MEGSTVGQVLQGSATTAQAMRRANKKPRKLESVGQALHPIGLEGRLNPYADIRRNSTRLKSSE